VVAPSSALDEEESPAVVEVVASVVVELVPSAVEDESPAAPAVESLVPGSLVAAGEVAPGGAGLAGAWPVLVELVTDAGWDGWTNTMSKDSVSVGWVTCTRATNWVTWSKAGSLAPATASTEPRNKKSQVDAWSVAAGLAAVAGFEEGVAPDGARLGSLSTRPAVSRT
jgi:hypothetical protein